MFDTYKLEEGDESLIAGAYGHAHNLCLVKSRWGEIWHNYRLRWSRSRLVDSLFPFDMIVLATSDWTIIDHPRSKEVSILQSNGNCMSFEKKNLAKAIEEQESARIPVLNRLCYWVIPRRDDLGCQIRRQLLASGSYPLSDLIESIQLANVMIDPGALVDSEIRCNSKLIKQWDDDCIAIEVKYSVLLPKSIFYACLSKLTGLPDRRGFRNST